MKGIQGMIGTFVTVFIVAALSQFIAIGGDVFALDSVGLKAILSSGVLALAANVVAYLNPADERYGNGAE